jgi:hypothetical protein
MAPPPIAESLKKSVENSKAEYVRLGNSGLRVSIPIFGAMSFGTPEWAPWVIDEEKVNYSSLSPALTTQSLFMMFYVLTIKSLFPSSKQHTIVVSIPGTQQTSIQMVYPRK